MVAPVAAAGASMAGRAAALQAGKLSAQKLAGTAGRNLVVQAPSIASQNAKNATWKSTLSPMIQNLAKQQQVELSEEELRMIEEQYGEDLIARQQAVEEALSIKERQAKQMQYLGAVAQALKTTKLGKLIDNKDPAIARQIAETVFGPGSMAEWPDGVTIWMWSTASLLYEGVGISKLIFKSKSDPNYFKGVVGLLEPVYPSPVQILSYLKYFQVGLASLVLFVIIGILSLFIGIVGIALYGSYSGSMAVLGSLGPFLTSLLGL